MYHYIPGKICRTNNDGPRKNTPCALPWKKNGKLYDGCTTDEDPDGKLWCSTKTSTDLEHVGGQGNWGYCAQSCLESDEFSGT